MDIVCNLQSKQQNTAINVLLQQQRRAERPHWYPVFHAPQRVAQNAGSAPLGLGQQAPRCGAAEAKAHF